IGVAPAELEDLLLGHEKVEDVAVLAIKDEYSGEVPKAYVVVKPSVRADESTARELLAYVREKKTRYKRVQEIEFTREIPKSASGKILRRVLRDTEKEGGGGLVVRERSDERAKL
ncbi:MAG: hypothetical protein INR71_03700, partial [Terriglobus roseus]|nr:hypothetical protein [Terriglobus roseus]